jgi:hypothetical protein
MPSCRVNVVAKVAMGLWEDAGQLTELWRTLAPVIRALSKPFLLDLVSWQWGSK